MIPLLSTLREPPVPGRFYMVPVLTDITHGHWKGAWPVLGPLHTDTDLFPHFPWPHYHIDFRFVTARQERRLSCTFRSALETIGIFPISHRPEAKVTIPKGLPPLAKRKCRRSSYGYALVLSDRDHVGTLEQQYGTPCRAITLRDGRKLCPHRKVDLSSFPPRPDGTVVCPLHGLTVQIAEPQQAAKP